MVFCITFCLSIKIIIFPNIYNNFLHRLNFDQFFEWGKRLMQSLFSKFAAMEWNLSKFKNEKKKEKKIEKKDYILIFHRNLTNIKFKTFQITIQFFV